jgi:hypothetical protein
MQVNLRVIRAAITTPTESREICIGDSPRPHVSLFVNHLAETPLGVVRIDRATLYRPHDGPALRVHVDEDNATGFARGAWTH